MTEWEKSAGAFGVESCTTYLLCNPHGRYNFLVATPRIELLEPWEEVHLGQADAFLLELAREISRGHPLSDVPLDPLGRSRVADDALFAMHDGRVVEVHLTWSHKAERPPWPAHKFYANVDEWIAQSMLPEHEGPV